MAAKAHLQMDQGSDFLFTFIVKEGSNTANLENYSGAAQLRKHYTSSNSVAFTVSVDANTAEVELSMYANVTSNIVSGRYVYDCELTNSSNNHVFRVVEGVIDVRPEVTR